MRKPLLAALLAVLVPAGGTAPALAARLPAIDIGIAPSKLQLKLIPGHTVHTSIRAVNKGRQAVVLDVSAEDYTISAASNVTFYPEGTLAGSAGPWTAFSTDVLRIPAGQVRELGVTITVPRSASRGTHTLAIVFKSQPVGSAGGGLQYQPAVASLLAAAVTSSSGGGLVLRGGVSATDVQVHSLPLWDVRSLGGLVDSLFHPTVTAVLHVRNSGNTFFNILRSTLDFTPGTSLGGSSQRLPLPHYTILPGSDRTIDVRWSHAPFAGQASMRASLFYNSTSAFSLPAPVGITIVPWNLLLLIACLLGIAVVWRVLRRAVRRRRGEPAGGRRVVWAGEES